MSQPSYPVQYESPPMNPLAVSVVKGGVGLGSVGVSSIADALHNNPTMYVGLLVGILTAISIAFDLRKKWRDRNK